MRALLRQATLLAVAAALSWWLFLHRAEPEAAPAPRGEALAVSLALARAAAAAPPAAAPTAAPEVADEPAPEPAPPPPELGAPDGADDGVPPTAPAATSPEPADPASPEPEDAPPTYEDPPADEADEPADEPLPQPDGAEPAEVAGGDPAPAPADDAAAGEPRDTPSPGELMRDEALLDAARRELDGEVRRGFATVLLASPEDQIDIARTFGEELVLVPKAALDPDGDREPVWFRLDLSSGAPRVETVTGPPPLERYRQYRDLFEYEYARLPEPLRELRRSVLARSEVYLFAALIPPAEWAAVIGRRRDALARAGRAPDEVRRFVLRTARTGAGDFDLRVEEIVFDDGTRYQALEPGKRP